MMAKSLFSVPTGTTAAVAQANQTLEIPFEVAYEQIAADVTPGTANSIATITTSNCCRICRATFHGQADGAHPTKFANTGTAGGLALELADRPDKMLIAPEASFSVLINQSDHTADFPLAARYYATSMPVTAGTFNSIVQVTFTYQ